MFIYFWRRESREREERGGRQRIPSRLHTVSAEPDVGLNPMNSEFMTWAEIKSGTLNWLSHPGALRERIFFFFFQYMKCIVKWERILSRLHTQHRAQCGAQSHDPGIMPWANVKSWTLHWLSHPGASLWGNLIDWTVAYLTIYYVCWSHYGF